MLARILALITRHLDHRQITRGPHQAGGGDVVLLNRFYVWPRYKDESRGDRPFRIFLHRLESPDLDRHLHDHPWTFVSVILVGGYTEEGVSGIGWPDTLRRHRRRWSRRLVPAGEVHAIRQLDGGPCWSLIIAGRRRREWGYLTETGWTSWHDYHYGPQP